MSDPEPTRSPADGNDENATLAEGRTTRSGPLSQQDALSTDPGARLETRPYDDEALARLAETGIRDEPGTSADEATLDFGRAASRGDEDLETADRTLPPAGANPRGTASGFDSGDAFKTAAEKSKSAFQFSGSMAPAPTPSSKSRDRRDGEKWQRIGRFRIEKPLGSGAFGNVYLAHDPQLDRFVAIKVAKMGALAADEDRRRFLREARAAAQLRHPHIVPVYEFGQVGESDFIAYQFIAGTTLRAILKKHRTLSVPRAVELSVKMASALDYAHSQGIVHRDVKPENILIDEAGEPHVADFGCARRDDVGGLTTVEGQVIGTAAYMSPEQASGQSHLADPRSDVWSLGVMMVEMLTGQRPFQGSLTQILIDIRDLTPKSIRQIDKSLPRDLETICQKCLAKKPAERFASAGELIAELQRWQRGEPILSRRIGLAQRTWRWARRNPAVASLILMVVSTMLLATLVSTYFFVRARGEQRNRSRDDARHLATAEPASIGDLLGQLPRVPFPEVARGELKSIQENATHEMKSRTFAALGLLALGNSPEAHAPLVEFVGARLLDAQAPLEEFPPILDGLRKYAPEYGSDLLADARREGLSRSERLRRFVAAALLRPLESGLNQYADSLIDQLLAEPAENIPIWLRSLTAMREEFREPLRTRFILESTPARQYAAALALGELFGDDLDLLVPLCGSARGGQLEPLMDSLAGSAAEAQTRLRRWRDTARSPSEPDDGAKMAARLDETANLEVALYGLGDSASVRETLRAREDPSLRSVILARFHTAGIDADAIAGELEHPSSEVDPAELAGWLLALGQFPATEIPDIDRENWSARVEQIYHTANDPGVHSAAAWTLRNWGRAPRVTVSGPAETSPPGDLPSWRISPTGQELVALGPVEFQMSSSPEERARYRPEASAGERAHTRVIDRRFEIGAYEVTVADFQRFEADLLKQLRDALANTPEDASRSRKVLGAAISRLENKPQVPSELSALHTPISNVSWYDAITYCRWLSDQEQLPAESMCYPPVVEIALALANPGAGDVEIPADILERTGYRLPTLGEWEYAARGGSRTAWFFGDDPSRLPDWGWFKHNAGGGQHPVGMKMPNGLGLFDVAGNVAEWCQSFNLPYPDESRILDSRPDLGGALRELRGGSFEDEPQNLRSSHRARTKSQLIIESTNGFRVARTVRPAPPGESPQNAEFDTHLPGK